MQNRLTILFMFVMEGEDGLQRRKLLRLCGNDKTNRNYKHKKNDYEKVLSIGHYHASFAGGGAAGGLRLQL